MSKISWHREPSEDPGITRWFALMAIGDPNDLYPTRPRRVRVADAVKTGTHLDDYPWDWQLTNDGFERLLAMLPAGTMGHPRSGGVMATLRDVKQHVEDLLNPR